MIDHVFLVTGPHTVTGIQTDKKGKLAQGFTAFTSEDRSSEYMSRSAALADCSDVLDLHNRKVIVCADMEVEKRIYAKAIPVSEHLWLDIRQLAWPLTMYGEVSRDSKLKDLCLAFDIKHEKLPDGSGECVSLYKLYWAMMTRYKSSLFGEELIRSAGGKTLASIRKTFGI